MSALVPVWADSLIVAALAGASSLGLALLVTHRIRLSGQVRHLVLSGALLVAPASLAGLALVRPGPIGCLSSPCSSADEAVRAGLLGQHYAFEAAGKFPADPSPIGPRGEVGRDLPGVLLGAWLSGTLILAIRGLRRRRAVHRLAREAEPIADADTLELAAAAARDLGLRRLPAFVHHPDVEHPMVGGVMRPSVYLPGEFTHDTPAARQMVLLHELAHVRRGDTLTGLGVELACILFWFVPLVWIVARRCARAQEVASDNCVVQRGIIPSAYADYLLRCWREMRCASTVSPATLSIAGDCVLTERIRSVLDPTTPRRPVSRMILGTAAVALLALVGLVVWSPAGLQAFGLLAQERRPTGPTLNRAVLTAPALDSLVRPIFINRMADRYVAGAAVAVVHGGRLIYAEGFGDREVYFEEPVEPARTIFRIGSITKALTAVAVLQLVDRGLVDLDADVNRYLDEFRVPDDFESPVRVRDLLTHTGGFDQIGLDRHAESPEEVTPLGEWIGANLVRIRPPGRISAYDTYGMTLAGHLVEKVSGLEYAEYLRSHVFMPLAMHRSGIDVPPALEEDVAVGYGFAGEWEALPWEHMNTVPASSVNSTVVDMANVMIILLGGGRFGGRQVLSARASREMLSRQHTNHPEQPGYGYALFENDWNGITTFSHAGSMTGYAAMLYLVPEYDIGIFIACNQESSSVIDPVLAGLLGALFPDARPPELRDRYEGRLDLSRFTGTYADNMYHHGDPDTGWKRRPFEVETTDDGALLFDGIAAWPVAPLTFQREDGLLLSFRANEAGRITHLFVRQAVYEHLD